MANPVLVGVDGSAESFAAARWAGEEAALRHLPVELLNVWQAPISNVQFSPAPEGLRFWEENQVREAGKELAERHQGLDITVRQVAGTPMNVLVEAAATAEMVVLGSRGLGEMYGFFQGSVGLHVAARSERPVVAVRAEGAARETGRREVVVGLDLGRPDDPPLAFAFASAAARGATVRALHVWDRHREYGYAAPPPGPQLARELRIEQVEGLAAMLAPWRARFPGVEVKETVVDGPVAQRLIEAADGTVLLVVGRRRRPAPAVIRIGPVTHAALHHAVCPVAIVPHD
ncbi:universal stress protein [Streptomyces sp. NBC_01476]|uniref:universal stress protein n=1 Tax=Streptomyces sp. NBC_01476 TaxID=2903881 RepID=UPI002E34D4ED|nr:universal stress protein [Streptomyces sp. NBC_01476]